MPLGRQADRFREPQAQRGQGSHLTASLRELPAPPDAVVINLPSEDVAAAIDDCGQRQQP